MEKLTDHQRSYWNKLARIDPDAAVIDPLDTKGHKNQYLAGIRDDAFSLALKNLSTDSLLLDVGCGTGSACLPLLRKGHALLGVDIALELLRHARVRCIGYPALFVATDGNSLPVKQSGFDAAIIYVVINYIVSNFDAHRMLSNIRDALKPGASLIMIEQVRRKSRVIDSGMKHQRALKDWVSLLSQAGFCDIQTRILRHGRFPTTPLIQSGLIPKRLWSVIARMEQRIAQATGVFPWDYAEVIFEART